MNYTLSTERIIRAFNMCSCSEISKGLIHVIKKDSFSKFTIKKDSKGKEYYSLVLSDIENETVEDLKKILEYYDVNLCTSLMNKSNFDRYFKSIKLK